MLLVSQQSPNAIRRIVDITWPSDSISRPPNNSNKVSTWLIAWSTASRSINNLAGGMLDHITVNNGQLDICQWRAVSSPSGPYRRCVCLDKIFFRKKPIQTPVISPCQIGHQFDVFVIVVGGRDGGISEGSNPAEMAPTTSICLLCQCRQWRDILARQTEKCR